MFKFAKIKRNWNKLDHPLEYGYCLIIDSFASLMDYELNNPRYKNAFQNALNMGLKSHLSDDTAYFVDFLAQMKGTGFITELCDLSEKAFAGRTKALERYGKIYVKKVGGYFVHTSDTEESEIVIKEEFIFPKDEFDKPRYIQWVNGRHWYVKCGSEDVVVNGNQKWCTKKAAEEAFEKWKTL